MSEQQDHDDFVTRRSVEIVDFVHAMIAKPDGSFNVMDAAELIVPALVGLLGTQDSHETRFQLATEILQLVLQDIMAIALRGVDESSDAP
jgi:hypothetical protein